MGGPVQRGLWLGRWSQVGEDGQGGSGEPGMWGPRVGRPKGDPEQGKPGALTWIQEECGLWGLPQPAD